MIKSLKYSYYNNKFAFIVCIVFFIIISGISIYSNYFVVTNGCPWYITSLKELLTSLFDGFFFYLIVQTSIERHKIKNDLTQILEEYKAMKHDILFLMLAGIENNNEKLMADVDRIFQSPDEARKYFTHEILIEITKEIQQSNLDIILHDVQYFHQRCSYFYSMGDPRLIECIFRIKNLGFEIRRLLQQRQYGEVLLFVDWTDDTEKKSQNPLYLLFCEKSPKENKDPICSIISNKLKEF